MTIKTFNINTDKTAFVRAYLPDSIAGLPFCEKRPAVLIFPGGGYEYCSDREGEPIALQYLALGYAAFVVTYSCNERFPEPLMDAAYIFYKIRMRAEEFKIDPQKMAVLGCSAGGHLAALTSTYTDAIDFEGEDDIDKISPVPNATILCYPVIHMPDETNVAHVGSYENLCGDDKDYAKYSPDLLVNDKTPTAFIWHTSEDDCVNVINSYLYASALRRHGIHHELHVFPDGPHGMGFAKKAPHVGQWAGLMKNWLGYLGWL